MDNETLAHRIIGSFYPPGELQELLWQHSRAVADKALRCINRRNLNVDKSLVELAALLHDIGIIETHAPSIYCHGEQPYITHGIIGANMLRTLGLYACARVCERHTGSGLTAAEIMKQDLPLPPRNFLPETEEEQLICYADKFFSKTPEKLTYEKPIESIRSQMQKFGNESLIRFDKLHSKFG